jgi:hypothetical protein
MFVALLVRKLNIMSISIRTEGVLICAPGERVFVVLLIAVIAHGEMKRK